MDKLPRHLERHAALYARCAEIVHCDSYSTDDTKAFLATTLRHSAVRQHDHPPGLYQSWNYAISLCTQPFIYISTVGDEMELPGLVRLYELAVQMQADFVISPPRFVDESGRVHPELRWPIHHLIYDQHFDRASLVSSRTVYLEAILHAPDGIMGSAASCLYRSAFLQPRPFPLGFHGACDSAWAIRYLPEARCAVLPETISSFLLHPKTYESHSVLNAHIRVLIRQFISKELIRFRSGLGKGPAPLDLNFDLLQRLRRFNLLDLLRARQEIRLVTLRERLRARWIVHPRVWRIRQKRNGYRALAENAADAIRDSMSSTSAP
jgi:hypothetical protein